MRVNEGVCCDCVCVCVYMCVCVCVDVLSHTENAKTTDCQYIYKHNKRL